MSPELISSGILAINILGIVLTIATFYYAKQSANAFGESTIGKTSQNISYGAALWIIYMITNGLYSFRPGLFEGYEDIVTLGMNLMLVGGIFFFAIAFNILAEVLE